jgi:ribosomal protein S18 acetylase RimI-like enzyme
LEIFEAKEVSDELVEAFQCLIPQLSSSAPEPTRAQIQEIVDSPAVTLLMARDAGKLVGALSLVVFRVPTGVHGLIEDVVVDQNARGKGIGEALTRAALDRAKMLGASKVELTSRPSREAANRLYVRIGFQPRHTNLYQYPIEPE